MSAAQCCSVRKKGVSDTALAEMVRSTVTISARAQRGVQGAHELGDTISARRGGGIALEHGNQLRCRSLTSLLNALCSNTLIPAGDQLRHVCCVCCGAQNMFDLGRFCQRVQVRRGGSVAGGTCRFPSSFARRFLRSLMGCQCACSLELRPFGAFGERPRRFDGGPRPSVARVTLLEDRQHLLGALRGIASDHAEILGTQLNHARFVRHMLTPKRAGSVIVLHTTSGAEEDRTTRPAPLNSVGTQGAAS